MMVICPECGKEFKRINRKFKMCSPECAKSRWEKQKKENDEKRKYSLRKSPKQLTEKEIDTSNAIRVEELRKDLGIGEEVKVIHDKSLRKCTVVKCYPYHVMLKLKGRNVSFGYDEVMRG